VNKQGVFRIVVLAVLSTAFGGCSTYNKLFPKIEAETKYQPLGEHSAIKSLSGEGTVTYVCTADDKGTFYKFENMSVQLYSSSNFLLAEILGPDQTLIYKDGSRAEKLIPLRWGDSEAIDNEFSMPDILFGVSDFKAKKGSEIEGMKYITRYRTVGGIPQIPCSQDQAGKTYSVPFQAKYLFWK
jgi:hypothetical protein